MSNSTLTKITALLAAITTVVVLITARWINSAIQQGFALQFGGVQNYKLAKQLYSSPKVIEQQKASLQQALDSVKDQPANNAAGTTTQPTEETGNNATKVDGSWTLTPDQLASVKKDAYVVGDKNAAITIIEYTDPECPYCIMQHKNGVLKQMISSYNGAVNTITKPVQWVNHPGTQFKSFAMLCAGKLGGQEAYEGMYEKIFGNSTPEKVVATSAIADYAKELKLNADKFDGCIENNEMQAVYDANWNEFAMFAWANNRGTPGNVILNTKTGEWKLLLGAYPATEFKANIDAMLAATK